MYDLKLAFLLILTDHELHILHHSPPTLFPNNTESFTPSMLKNTPFQQFRSALLQLTEYLLRFVELK